ncbi:hemagglutinin repeat-containing protein [Thauera linaloolentis]|uniref:Hemagglutinin-related protein n=1 Tax=Thauera linaloolentis (strain DSM 12138 / JCM 21573 / CCUG 41526 / CIP 105981 / IAM 15112 / NBRC 102519 / 47Lol) TaxID=1123367 RepID=N6Y6L1_THAL4|nr:hemagglutinin repeat-containing protein [Thauera linaloolentis]ENO89831.1 hemagglutinin-related protein [Thauera linaloolentis 47Lol = DSM 12138]MCM8566976.1 hemagglutinin repeat-containing protein [Thauera linaloolentis]
MNARCHRLVFNRLRGMLMAVAETAMAQGGSPRGTAGGTATPSNGFALARLRPVCVATLFALGSPSLAQAQIVAYKQAPANQQATVLKAGNGIPVVNIQTPSAAGVSRNAYGQFDIQAQGAILNNSRGNIQSQLGGWIQGNPWLAAGDARVILNEVISPNPSQLLGYIEIAGSTAQLIIANPAGITCDGCGFINANRATLTTGTPIVTGGDLDGYRVENGTIRIAGAGMNTTNLGYTDLIARAVEVNAGLWAQTLKITTGANVVDAGHSQAAPIAGSGAAPGFAVDVAQLGGMYAGKIHLVGTEAGVGVRNAGTFAATAGDVLVTAEGRLINRGAMLAGEHALAIEARGVDNSGTLSSATAITLASQDDLANSGLMQAGEELRLDVSGTLANHAGMLDGQRLDIRAGALDNAAGTLRQSGMQALRLDAGHVDNAAGALIGNLAPRPANGESGGTDGGGSESLESAAAGVIDAPADTGGTVVSVGTATPRVFADGRIAIRDQLINTGILTASGLLTLATEHTLTNAGTLNLDRLSVAGDTFRNQGTVDVAHASFDSTSFDNGGGRLTVSRRFALASHDILNAYGSLRYTGTEALAFSPQGRIDNSNGQIASNGIHLTLAAAAIDNTGGSIEHAGSGTLALVTDRLDGSSGLIASQGTLDLDAGAIDLDNATTQGDTLALSAGTLSNRGGRIIQNGGTPAVISIAGQLDNHGGLIASAASLGLTAGGLDNRDGGQIVTNGSLALDTTTSALINNGGTLSAQDKLSIRSADALGNTAGLVVAGHDLDITAVGALDNSGGTLGAVTGRADIAATGNLTSTAGRIEAATDLTLSGHGLANDHGTIFARTVQLDAQGQDLSNTQGRIAAETTLSIDSGRLDNIAGLLQAGTTLDVDTHGQALINRDTADSGGLIAQGNLTLDAGAVDNAGGTIGTAGTLVLDAATLSNRGGRITQAGSNLTALAVAGQIDNRDGLIASAASLDLTASELDNRDGGQIVTDGSLILSTTAGPLRNDGGTMFAQAIRIDAQDQTLSNVHGQLIAETRLTADSGRFDNTAGLVQAGTTLGIDTRGQAFINRDTADSGGLLARGSLTLDTGAVDNTNGTIGTGATLALDAQALDNQHGRITQAGSDLTALSVAGRIDNRSGLIASAASLDLTAGGLDNRDGGQIITDGSLILSTTAGALHNDGGALSAQGSLALQSADTLGNAAGRIVAGKDLGITASGALDNTSGTLGAVAGRADIIANGTATNANGRIEAAAALDLSSQGLVNDHGSLSARAIHIDTHGQALSNVHGQLIAETRLTAGSGRFDNTAGLVQAGTTLDVDTHGRALINRDTADSGGLLAQSDLTLSTGAVDNTNGTIGTAGTLALDAGTLSNRNGRITQAGSNLTAIAVAGQLDNRSGLIASAASLDLTAGGLDNRDGGQIITDGSLILNTTTGALHNDGGTLSAQDDLSVRSADALGNAAGQIVAGKNLDIATAGALDNTEGRIQAGNTLDVDTHGQALINRDTADNGGLLAQGKLTLATGELDNAGGTIGTGATLALNAATLSNHGGRITQAGSDLTALAVTGQIDNRSGLIASTASLDLTAGELDNHDGGQILTDGSLVLNTTTGTLHNDGGTLSAQDDLSVRSADALGNAAGQIVAGKNLDIDTAGALDNTGGTLGAIAGRADISASGNLTGIAGRIEAATDLTLSSHGLANDHGTLVARTIQLDAQGQTLSNTHGQIAAAAALAIDSGQLDNTAGLIQAGTTLDVDTHGQALINRDTADGGGLIAQGNLTLDTGAVDNARGTIGTAGTLALDAATLSNRGGRITQAGSGLTALAAAGRIDNRDGLIASAASLDLTAGELDNRDGGQIATDGSLVLNTTAGALANDGGTLSAQDDLSIRSADALGNAAGQIVAGKNLDIAAATLDNSDGTLGAVAGWAHITADSAVTNASGRIEAATDLTLSGHGLNNDGGTLFARTVGLDTHGQALSNTHGRIAAATALTIDSGRLDNTAGLLQAGATLDLDTHGQALINRDTADGGGLLAQGNLTLDAGAVDNVGGTIGTGAALALDASALTNHGGRITQAGSDPTALAVAGHINNRSGLIASAASLDLTAGELDNRDGGQIVTDGSLALSTTAGALRNDGGTLSAQDDLSVQSTDVLGNTAGRIVAGKDLDIATAGALDNTSGTLGAVAGQALVSADGAVNNTSGHIEAATDLTLSGQGLNNDGGTLFARAVSLDTHGQALSNTHGQIAAAAALAIDSGQLDNTAGLIQAGTTLDVDTHGQALVNRDTADSGGLIAQGNLTLDAGAVDNTRGAIGTTGALALDAASISNHGGRITQAGSGLTALAVAGRIDNRDGLIASAASLGLTAGELDNRDGGQIVTDGSLVLNTTSGALRNDGGTLSAQDDLSIQSTDTLGNAAGRIVAGKDLDIDTAGTLDNTGGTLGAVTGRADITADGAVNNTSGRIEAATALALSGHGLTNDHGTLIARAVSLDTQGQALSNTHGQIAAEAALAIDSGQLDNTAGLIQAGTTLHLDTHGQALINRDTADGGGLLAQGNLTLDAGAVDNTGGTIGTGAALALDAQALDNRHGHITQAGGTPAAISVAGQIDNRNGLIASAASLGLTAGELDNRDGGQIVTDGSLVMNTMTGALANDGGTLSAQDDLAVQSADALGNAAGRIVAGKDLDIAATGALDNTSGTLGAVAGRADISADGAINNTGGRIEAATDLTLSSRGLANDHGTLIAHAARIDTHGQALDNTHGQLAAETTLAIDSGQLDNTAGLIQAGATLDLDTHGRALINRDTADNGGLLAQGTLTLATGELDNVGGTIGTGATLALDAQALDNRQGRITQAGSDLATLAVAGQVDNRGGLIASAASLGLTAGELDNRDDGQIVTDGSLVLNTTTGALRNDGGTLSAQDDLSIRSADVLGNAAGRIVAGKNLDIAAASALDNDGGTLGAVAGQADIDTGGILDNTSGRIEAATDLTLSSHGLTNEHGTLVARAAQIDTHEQALENTHGQIVTETALAIDSGQLDNTAGLIQAGTTLDVDTHGQALINRDTADSGGLIAQGDITIAAGTVDNTAGFVRAGGVLGIDGESIANQDGHLLAQAGMDLAAATVLDNQGGNMQTAGDLDIRAISLIDNRSGLMRAGGALTAETARLVNAATQATDKGIEGHTIDISAPEIDNRDGALRADDALILRSGQTIDNRSGLVSSRTTLTVLDDSATRALAIDNLGGTFIADGELSLHAGRISGDGRLRSNSDLAFDLDADIVNTGEISTAGDIRMTTTGTLSNSGTVRAGDELVLKASSLTNEATGTLAGGMLDISVSGTLDNHGLIDGGETRIQAGTLDNLGSGRIYGDHLAITAGTLNNLADGSSAPVIAARERLDLGVGALNNRDEALIFSAGDLSIGGSLDANRRATGQADSIDNVSATIEATGNLAIDTASLINRKRTFDMERQPSSGPQGGIDLLDYAPGLQFHWPIAESSIGIWRDYIRDRYINIVAKMLGGAPDEALVNAFTFTEDNEDSFPVYRRNWGAYHEFINLWGDLIGYDGPTGGGLTEAERARLAAAVNAHPLMSMSDSAAIWRVIIDTLAAEYPEHLARMVAALEQQGVSQTAYRQVCRDPENECDYTYDIATTRQYQRDIITADSPAAILRAGGNMTLNAGTLDNRYSIIQSGGDMALTGSTLLNTGAELFEQTDTTSTEHLWHWVSRDHGATTTASSTQTLIGSVLGIISAGGTLTGSFTQRIDNLSIRHNAAPVVDATGAAPGTLPPASHDPALIGSTADSQTDTDHGVNAQRAAATGSAGTHLATVSQPGAAAQTASADTGLATATQPNASAQTANADTRLAAAAQPGSTAQTAAADTDISTAPQPGAAVHTANADTRLATASRPDSTARTTRADTDLAAAAQTDPATDAPLATAIQPDASARTLTADTAPADGAQAETATDIIAHETSHGTGGTITRITRAAAASSGDAPTAIVATAAPALALPASRLYHIQPDGPAGYLIETDPAFTHYQTWLSSDYMLEALGLDPALIQKRLGDGFYEQRLLTEQIAQLTGRRFLPGHADDEAQYRALMNAGVTYAREWQLVPGVALSAEQMARLTTDIVWLVEESVTLADGSTQRVLVPRIYASIRQGDLTPEGALLAGGNVALDTAGELFTSGTIAGRQAVLLTGTDISVERGTVVGRDVTVQASQDLAVLGGQIRAERTLQTSAGRDLSIESTTVDRDYAPAEGRAANATVQRTAIERVAGLYVTGEGGTLVAAAGRDLSLLAAAVSNAGDGSTRLGAGRDLVLGTVTETSQASTSSKGNRWREDSSTERGTLIDTAGDLSLSAGRDLSARAADVTAGGTLAASTARDLTIDAGEATLSSERWRKSSKGNALSKRSRETLDTLDQRTALASTFSGDSVALAAGNDLSVHGSNVVATTDLTLAAGRDLRIEAATETHAETHFRKEKKSGLSTSGASLSVGSQKLTQNTDTDATTAVGSTVGSVQGNITLVAGRQYTQTGSDVLAPGGDIDIAAQTVDIVEAREASAYRFEQKFKQSGLTLSISSPVLSAVQTVRELGKAVSDTDDGRMHALAAASTALAGKTAYDAVIAGQGTTIAGKDGQIATEFNDKGEAIAGRDANAADKVGGINISISVGSASSKQSSTQTTDTATGSTVQAGGDIRISATGAGEHSDLTLRGAQVTAGGKATLAAEDEIRLLAAENRAEQHSDNTSSSASIGIGFALGGSQNGFTLQLGASQARGDADGDDHTWTHTHVQAGDTATLTSGGDTAFRGAVVSADRVAANIGGNLVIESLQDIHTYDSRQKNAGFSLSLCIPPFCYGATSTGSISLAGSNIDSDYASVTERSGIEAGDGGFDVKVGGDTTLTGAAIASTDQAVEEGRNRFSTGGTLTLADLENRAEYDAQGASLNIGTGVSFDGAFTPQGTSAGFGEDSDSARSITTAGISGIAGDTAVRTGDAPTGIAPIFDAEAVQKEIDAQVRITQTFNQYAPKVAADFAATQANELRRQGNTEEAAKWEEGGAYRIALHAAIGGLSGGVEGALGAGAAASSAPLLDRFQDSITQELKNAGASDGVADLAGQLISGTTAAGIGAVVSGGSTAGTAMGMNVDANNRQLHPREIDLIEERVAEFIERMKREGLVLDETQALNILAENAADQVDYLDQITPNDGNSYLNAQAKLFLQEVGAEAGSFIDTGGREIKYFTTRTADGQHLQADFYDPARYVETYNSKAYQDFAHTHLNRNLLGGNPTPEALRTYIDRETDQGKRAMAAALLLTGGGGTALAAKLAPRIAAAGTEFISACTANPVLCLNQLGITAADLGLGEALPTGLGVATANVLVNKLIDKTRPAEIEHLTTRLAQYTPDELLAINSVTAFKDGNRNSAEAVNAYLSLTSGAQAPYMPGTAVRDVLAQPGQRLYIIENASASGPGGWAGTRIYTDLNEARQQLALLPEWKNPQELIHEGNTIMDSLVIREYTVRQPLPTRRGMVGPQDEYFRNAQGELIQTGQQYPGGGQQIELLIDIRKDTKDPATGKSLWQSYLLENSEYLVGDISRNPRPISRTQ